METNTENHNFGRLVAGLSIERQILSDGILPEKGLIERSQVVEGIVDGLMERGKWRSAVRLVFGDGPGRLLYEGDKYKLCQWVKDTVKPNDFTDSRFGMAKSKDKDLELLAQRGQISTLYDIATTREDISYYFSLNLLNSIRKEVGADRFARGVSTVAARLPPDRANEAYDLFKQINDAAGIEGLYQRLMDDFSVNSFDLLTKMINHSSWEDKKDRFKQVIEKTFHNEHGKGKVLDLYNLMLEQEVELPEELRTALEEEVVSSLKSYNVEKCKNPVFQLDWAKTNWEKSPENAYKLFKECRYDGEETIKAALVVYKSQMQERRREKTSPFRTYSPHIEEKHMRTLFKHVPVGEWGLRLQIAEDLRDKQKIRDVRREASEWHKNEGYLRKAYELHFESGADDSDPFFADIRERTIRGEIKRAQEIGANSLLTDWLNPRDRVGYEMVFEAILDEFPTTAYCLAENKKDAARIQKAGDKILAVMKPEDSLSFFKHKDTVNYQRAIGLVAEKYETSPAVVIELLGK